MAARDILKNFALFIDGRGFAGQIDQYSPPDLSLTVEDFRAGGMDAPIALDMGQEAMETSFILAAYDADVLRLWGVRQGGAVAMTARGALESYDGTVRAVIHRMRGTITSLQRGDWQPGTKAQLTVTARLDYYAEEIAGEAVTEIDVINMIRVIGGVDQLAAQRAALGI